MTDVDSVFVYGTLKTGQIRERMWPRKPLSITVATTNGVLYDLGSYPAMTQGTDVVRGEVWRIDAADMTETLKVLDEIEDYRDQPDDLYKRVVVECELQGGAKERGRSVMAYTYFYAFPLDESTRVQAVEGVCEWPV